MLIDKNENRVLHPALDYYNKTLVIGFRYLPQDDGKEKNVYVISEHGKTPVLQTDRRVTIGSEVLEIDEKNRTLPRVAEKWSMQKLVAFIENENEDATTSLVDGNGLFDDIRNLFKTYVYLGNETDYTILTAFVISSYLFQGFPAFPYLHIKAPKNSGKTQILSMLEELAFNAVKAQATYPSFRDTVDAQKGTFLIDQAGDIFSARNPNAEFQANLTDSYKKTSARIRKMIPSSKSGTWTVEEFDAYAPKGFASTNDLPEDLRDRCIIVPLVRTNKSFPAVDSDNPIWKQMRGRIYEYVISNHDTIIGMYQYYKSSFAKTGEVTGRKFELLGPIVCTMGGMLGFDNSEIETVKNRFLERYQFSQFEARDFDYEVLKKIFDLLDGSDSKILTPKEIANAIEDDLFYEEFGINETSFAMLSVRRKTGKVGHIIGRYNMATKKMPRSRSGERYLFTKENLLHVKEGNIPSESEEQNKLSEKNNSTGIQQEQLALDTQ